jgi:hypothetical protein
VPGGPIPGGPPSTETRQRQWLPGSPYRLRVSGVKADPGGSYIGGADTLEGTEVSAGERVALKPHLRDQFGNASPITDGDLRVTLTADSSEIEMPLRTLPGIGMYEVSHEVSRAGPYSIQFLLQGHHISGSPVDFRVLPGAPVGNKSKITQTSEAIVNQPALLKLETFDRYGNALNTGGASVVGRALGSSVSACTVEDNEDGTYTISFSSAVEGKASVIVRLDNAEIPAVQVFFQEDQSGAKEEAKGKGGGGGKADQKEGGGGGGAGKGDADPATAASSTAAAK